MSPKDLTKEEKIKLLGRCLIRVLIEFCIHLEISVSQCFKIAFLEIHTVDQQRQIVKYLFQMFVNLKLFNLPDLKKYDAFSRFV